MHEMTYNKMHDKMYDRIYKSGAGLAFEINNAVPQDNELLMWFLGQMGFAVKTGGLTLFFDPLLNDFTDELGCSRLYPPLLLPGKELHADYFIASHDHADHLNLETILPHAKANPHTRFVVPYPAVQTLTDSGVEPCRVIGAKAGCKIALNESVTLTPIAACHTSYKKDISGCHHYLGSVINNSEICFYHAGDTIVTEELIADLQKMQHVNIAVLPINGTDWQRSAQGLAGNMSVEDAVKFACAINADLTIPAHYDLMPDNSCNPALFAEAMYRICPNKKFHIFSPGECFVYRKPVIIT
ncbi:MAG: MBL fold metallo-hydrolase [Spirochaetaceae bacterium]|jgi:L-ascorbate metabolism protein UlaG (beta-lactamase superfamily)|nr:MBL fold metallo-hydrolase [Spirochaetaceae bacterium]